jgi:hypothetical protein
MATKKVRGSLYPSFREIEMYRKNFVEGANLQGRSGLLYQVDTESQVNTDEYYNWKSPVNVSYYLVDNPQKSILQKYGWFVEDKERQPIICYLTFKDAEDKPINPSEGAILEVSTRLDPHDGNSFETLKFDIVKVATDYDLAMFICNLAPHRKHLTPVNPVPTQDDSANENKWFNRKLIGEDDLIGEIDDIDTL